MCQAGAFGAGWIRESISVAYMVLGAGVAVGFIICTPNWGVFNRNPLTFATASELAADMAAGSTGKGAASGKAVVGKAGASR